MEQSKGTLRSDVKLSFHWERPHLRQKQPQISPLRYAPVEKQKNISPKGP
jgi:hypothetical protein